MRDEHTSQNPAVQLHLRAAEPQELARVRDFYWDLADAMQQAEYGPKWQREVYPAEEDLRAYLEAGELYVGETDDGTLAAALVLNQRCNDEYAEVAWPSGAAADEALVVHLLCVAPELQGRGLARQLVSFAIAHAREAGMPAVRLDVIKGNLPAARLYERAGFVPVCETTLFYEDTGRTAFTLYELALDVDIPG